jgi:hypothetical protein
MAFAPVAVQQQRPPGVSDGPAVLAADDPEVTAHLRQIGPAPRVTAPKTRTNPRKFQTAV